MMLCVRFRALVDWLPPWLKGGWRWATLVITLLAVLGTGWTFTAREAYLTLLVSDLAFLPFGLFTIGAAARLWLTPTLPTTTRNAWRWLTWGLIANFIGEILWALYELVLQVENPLSTVADVFYLGFYPLVMLGLLRFAFAPIAHADRQRLRLEIAIVIVTSAMGLWNFVLAPQVADLMLDWESVIAVAYPVADLVVLYGLLVCLFRQPEAGWRGALGYLLLGMGIYLIADVWYAIDTLNGTYQSGGLLDALWWWAWVAFGWAALADYASVQQVGEGFARPRSLQYLWMLPYVMLGLGYTLTLWTLLTHPTVSAALQGLFLGSVVLTALVSWRHLIDLRENQRLAAALRAQLQQLHDADSALSRAQYRASLATLATGMAHELQNPFAVITANAGNLRRRLGRGELPPQTALAAVERIERAAWHGSQIVAALEVYVRGGELTLTRVSPAGLVQDAVDLAQVATVPGLTLEQQVAANAPAIICDREKIGQVLVHVLTNARDAITPPGTITLIAMRHGADGLRLMVADSGTGMPPEVLAHAFDLFYTTKEVDRGHGLGLPICRGIVQAHGGQIHLASQVGQGTTVVLDLPAEPPAENHL